MLGVILIILNCNNKLSKQVFINGDSPQSRTRGLALQVKKKIWCFLFCKEDVTLLQGALKNC